MKKKVILHDYGREEYLDGSRARYSVGVGEVVTYLHGRSASASPLAYFFERRHALLFAEALAARESREVLVFRERAR